jgi:hypothetical protein
VLDFLAMPLSSVFDVSIYGILIPPDAASSQQTSLYEEKN